MTTKTTTSDFLPTPSHDQQNEESQLDNEIIDESLIDDEPNSVLKTVEDSTYNEDSIHDGSQLTEEGMGQKGEDDDMVNQNERLQNENDTETSNQSRRSPHQYIQAFLLLPSLSFLLFVVKSLI